MKPHQADRNRPKDIIARLAQEDPAMGRWDERELDDDFLWWNEFVRPQEVYQPLGKRYLGQCDIPHRYWGRTWLCNFYSFELGGPTLGLSEYDMEQRRNRALGQLVDQAFSQWKTARTSSPNSFLDESWERISVDSQFEMPAESGDIESDYEYYSQFEMPEEFGDIESDYDWVEY